MRIRIHNTDTETTCQVAKYEATIETYKKRLEEMGDLRGQIKYLEEKNTEYIQKNLDLEDELGNLNKKRPQVWS
jgi:protein HOOK3